MIGDQQIWQILLQKSFDAIALCKAHDWAPPVRVCTRSGPRLSLGVVPIAS